MGRRNIFLSLSLSLSLSVLLSPTWMGFQCLFSSPPITLGMGTHSKHQEVEGRIYWAFSSKTRIHLPRDQLKCSLAQFCFRQIDKYLVFVFLRVAQKF